MGLRERITCGGERIAGSLADAAQRASSIVYDGRLALGERQGVFRAGCAAARAIGASGAYAQIPQHEDALRDLKRLLFVGFGQQVPSVFGLCAEDLLGDLVDAGEHIFARHELDGLEQRRGDHVAAHGHA